MEPRTNTAAFPTNRKGNSNGRPRLPSNKRRCTRGGRGLHGESRSFETALLARLPGIPLLKPSGVICFLSSSRFSRFAEGDLEHILLSTRKIPWERKYSARGSLRMEGESARYRSPHTDARDRDTINEPGPLSNY